ncbi:hypothetical protein PENTCL1PPCAC_3528, partial [Pristionchus entomophagus]
ERLADDQACRAAHEESRWRIDHIQRFVRRIQCAIARNRSLRDHEDDDARSCEGIGRIVSQLQYQSQRYRARCDQDQDERCGELIIDFSAIQEPDGVTP